MKKKIEKKKAPIKESFRVKMSFFHKIQDLKAFFIKPVNSRFFLASIDR